MQKGAAAAAVVAPDEEGPDVTLRKLAQQNPGVLSHVVLNGSGEVQSHQKVPR